jgi:predicted acyl esterase
VRDGTLLGCDLSLPGTDANTPATGRFPAVLDGYTPYYGYRAGFNGVDGAMFSTHGYAMLTCNVRGTGDSAGTYGGFAARPQELRDGYDLIEWMARQPWSNGRVGMEGTSYGGLTTLGVAALHPPHLDAISPQQPPSDMYSNYTYPGGMKTTPHQYDAWPDAVSQLADRPDLGAKVEAEWLAHPNKDAYWRSIDWAKTLYPRVTLPTLLIQAGRSDNYFRGSLDDNYRSIVQNRSNAWMIVGPWAHGLWAGTTEPQLPITTVLGFFDRFVAGKSGAPTPGSHVVSYQEPQGGTGAGWQQLGTWPVAAPRGERLYLSTKSTLKSTRPGKSAIATYHGQMPAGSSGLSGKPPVTTGGTSALFTSAPQKKAVTIRGEIGVHLRASSSGSDANVYAEVWDVSPGGKAAFLSDGALKGSHRASLATTQKVRPGQFYDYDFKIWPSDWKLAEGHRLELRLSAGSTDFFQAPASPSPAVTVALGGRDAAFLTLP